MTVHWPRLKVLRDLHVDTYLSRLELDRNKAALRVYMRVL